MTIRVQQCGYNDVGKMMRIRRDGYGDVAKTMWIRRCGYDYADMMTKRNRCSLASRGMALKPEISLAD
jgi:hypothetical protein